MNEAHTVDPPKIPVTIGHYQTNGGQASFPIDAAVPTWILGKTRTGKSTAMLAAFKDTVSQGRGCLLQDPHGPLAEAALHHIPRERLKDVILIDPTKSRVPGIGFFHPTKPSLSVEWLINIIELRAGKFWGPQSEEILYAIALAVVEHQKKPTILHVYKALARPAYCEKLLRTSRNPQVQDFYARWFSKDFKARDRLLAFSHPLNKVIVFLRDYIKEVVCQQDTIDWRAAIDAGKIIIVRLPKGEIGETAARFLGSLIIFNILLIASERESWEHFPLFIDELQNFLDGIPFELMLAELAKWNITPFFATQTQEQMRDEERRIFNDRIALGNVSTLISFRVSGEDSEQVAKFAGFEDQAPALVKLDNYTFAASTVKNSIPTWTFPISTIRQLSSVGTVPYFSVVRWAIENTNMPTKVQVCAYIDRELEPSI